jgi:hypothetical protein
MASERGQQMVNCLLERGSAFDRCNKNHEQLVDSEVTAWLPVPQFTILM